jgi:hypothetical protein
MLPSLEAKLRQLMDGLTPDDSARLRAMQGRAGAGELSPSLRAMFERCASGLTPEEAHQIRFLSRLADAGAAGDGVDTAGHAVGLYVGDDGNKGRPQPGVPANAAGHDPAHVIPDVLGQYLVPAFWPLVDLVRYLS